MMFGLMIISESISICWSTYFDKIWTFGLFMRIKSHILSLQLFILFDTVWTVPHSELLVIYPLWYIWLQFSQYLPQVFCEAIGITKLSNVTLKTSISDISSWQVRVAPYKHSSHHVAWPGWKSFCRDNRINVGDICTINIFETALWQVDITRQ